MQTRRHRLVSLSWSLACGAALAGVACGDDGGDTGATAGATTGGSAATTTTTTTTSATTSGPTTTTATSGSDSDSDTGAAPTTTGEVTTGEQTTGGGESTGVDPGDVCEPGATESCYTGPDGTLDVGVCVAGTRTCNDRGTGFGPCEGEVTPTPEDCGTAADEDCLGDVPECGDALWSERFGGVASDESTDLAVGPDDGVVLTGVFDAGSSVQFGGATFPNKGSFDGFVASFDGDGKHRWSRAFGGPTSDAARSVAVDSAGAVIVTGDTQGAVDLGGGLLTGGGDQDVIVAKYGGDGKHLWSAIYKSPDLQVGLHCAVTSADAVILGGVFRGSLDLGGGPLISAGLNDIYLAKLDAAGKHLWSKRFGDAAVDYLAATEVDPSGAIVQAGYFAGGLDYGGGALTSAGGQDVFVAKLDAGGGHQWSKRFGDAGNQRAEAAAVAADGRVLVGGSFDGALDFGGDVLTSVGGKDAFLVVLDADGGHLWSRSFGGPKDDRVTTITVDPAGDVVVGGVFAGSIDLDGATLTNDGLYGAFLAEFDPAGELLFSASYGAGDTSWITNVAADSLGHVLVAGLFTGMIDVGGELLSSVGLDDIFLAKLAI